jgi:hypothetical protein
MRAILAASVSAALVSLAMAAPACVIPTITQNSDAGSASAASSSDGGSTAAVQGASCTSVSASVSLCQYISSCPSLSLSPQVFPECGFQINGDALDPECLCDNHYLCPVGHPTSCTEAAAEASGDTTYDSVCEQEVTGGCTDLTAGTSSTSSSSGGATPTTTACQSCINACGNVPTCIDACQC